MKHGSLKPLVVILLVGAGGLVTLVKRPANAEARGTTPLAAPDERATEDDFDEDPSEDCAVDAGGGKDLPNGSACKNPSECASHFCSRLDSASNAPGTCAACAVSQTRTKADEGHGNANNEYTINGVHTVLQCREGARIWCSTSFHRPCAGTHSHVLYETCIAGRNSGGVKKGVICNGGAPVIAADCSGQTKKNDCDTQGSASDGRLYEASGGRQPIVPQP